MANARERVRILTYEYVMLTTGSNITSDSLVSWEVEIEYPTQG